MQPYANDKNVNNNTRCEHYNSALDIIAIKLKCCDTFYDCIYCHNEATEHSATVWLKDEQDIKAVQCGNCKTEMSIKEYLNCNNSCPYCDSLFNPKCSNHYHFYFEE